MFYLRPIKKRKINVLQHLLVVLLNRLVQTYH